MRFISSIKIIGALPLKLPSDYRKNIASLIKEAIKQQDADQYQKYWGNKNQNTVKPFTFSLHIPGAFTQSDPTVNYLQTGSDTMQLFCSSCDPEFLIRLYNGLLNLKEYTPFNKPETYPITLQRFNLLKDPSFTANAVRFKTVSPLVVRHIKNKKGIGYVTFADKEFSNMLYHEMANLCRHFLAEDYALDKDQVTITPVNCALAKIYHYTEVIPATSGIIDISAPREVLKLVYDAGLGARRSQGFGMLEVAG